MFSFSSLPTFLSDFSQSITSTFTQATLDLSLSQTFSENFSESFSETRDFSDFLSWQISHPVSISLSSELQSRILALSLDERNVTVSAPDESIFYFDMKTALPYALAMLQKDKRLDPLRFRIVPKRMSDEQFWRNYFYRVARIREQMGVEPIVFVAEEIGVHDRGNVAVGNVEMKEQGEQVVVSSEVDDAILDGKESALSMYALTKVADSISTNVDALLISNTFDAATETVASKLLNDSAFLEEFEFVSDEVENGESNETLESIMNQLE